MDDNTKYSTKLKELLYNLITRTSTVPNSMVVRGVQWKEDFSIRISKGEQKSTGQILAMKRPRSDMNYKVI